MWLAPGAARAYAQGILCYPAMAFDERSLFVTVFNDQALFFQGAFALHEAGQLEEETYQAYLRWFAANVATRGGQAWWEEIGRPIYTRRMVIAVEERLAAGDLPDVGALYLNRMDDLEAESAGAT